MTWVMRFDAKPSVYLLVDAHMTSNTGPYIGADILQGVYETNDLFYLFIIIIIFNL
jgi:hypothetical protein